MTTTFVSQEAYDLGLEWYPGDPVSLSWRVAAVNWAGTYVAKLRANSDVNSTEIATFTVTATYDSVNLWTTFLVTLATSVPQGNYYWSCKQTGGMTRFSGNVYVDV
jgi:hypothetical protein